MNRKTALILSVAVGLVAAAILLGKRNASKGIEPAGSPGIAAAGSCGAGAPARATSDFGHGTVSAAFSSARVLGGGDGEVFLSVDLAARESRSGKRPPLNLAIVIDRSGSMEGEKLAHARTAAQGIIDRLGAQDRVALVQYDDTAQVLVPSVVLDESGKARLRAAISSLFTGGSTNLHDGMTLGRDEVLRSLAPGRVNRVVLLSDGLANVGIQDTPTLASIAGAAAEKGVRLTTVGLGLDYNEDLMEAIAESGRGQYYYVRDAATLDSVFAGEIRSMQATVATHAELRLEPCAGVEILEVFGYEIRREGDAVIVPLADVFGGDSRKLVARLRVPVSGRGAANVVTARLSFDDATGGGHRSYPLALGLEVTDDEAAVKASVDRSVMGYVVEVEAARSMREAAAAYDKGDVTGAQNILRIGRTRAEAQASEFALPPAATEEVYADFESTGSGMSSYAPGSAGGKALIKGTKQKARNSMKMK